jgi:Flp pilus assembly CpaF family ATPase
MSFEVILPFLRPIEHLLADSQVSEIMVNGSSRVFVERDGILQTVPGIWIPERSLCIAVRNIARILGDDISDEKPILDLRLPDGSRVAAILAPCFPYAAIRTQIAESLNFVLHIDRQHGKRQAAELLRIVGYNRESDTFESDTMFCSDPEMHAPSVGPPA